MDKLLKNVLVLLLVIALFMCLCLGKGTSPGPVPTPSGIVTTGPFRNFEIDGGDEPQLRIQLTSSSPIPENEFKKLLNTPIKEAISTIKNISGVSNMSFELNEHQTGDSDKLIGAVGYSSNYKGSNNFIYNIFLTEKGISLDSFMIEDINYFNKFNTADLPEDCKKHPSYGYYDDDNFNSVAEETFKGISKEECLKKYGGTVDNKLINFVEYNGKDRECSVYNSPVLKCNKKLYNVFV